jgi:hypothetical protein
MPGAPSKTSYSGSDTTLDLRAHSAAAELSAAGAGAEGVQEVRDQYCERLRHSWIGGRCCGGESCEASLRVQPMLPVQVQRLGADSGGVRVDLVAAESVDQYVGVDGLQDAERVQGVLLLEPVGLAIDLGQPLPDLDGLGR